jgi:hypothetical protein
MTTTPSNQEPASTNENEILEEQKSIINELDPKPSKMNWIAEESDALDINNKLISKLENTIKNSKTGLQKFIESL